MGTLFSGVDLVDLVEKFLIEMHLSSFCECYPHKNIPKQSYMTHFRLRF